MKIYITTSIPYVNAQPHIGHALEMVQADVIARLHRQLGHEVIFQTGTDENAFKNVLAAKKAEISVQDFVDKNAQQFRNLIKELNISAETFIRTTELKHKKGVYHFWKKLNPDDLYLKEYSGLYCDGCEDFYNEKDLINGICPDHQTAPRAVSERNVFFRLSKYQTKLIDLLKTEEIHIYPNFRKAEILSFLEQGLQDISISRLAERAGGWGIPVPEHPDQVIYVWIDALINYLSGQEFGTSDKWKDIWNNETRKIHVIGKNIWKFHAIYWPALLLSANLPLPNDIVVHGFLTENGKKISKSLGNAIHPTQLVEKYTSDGLRHYLTKQVPALEDGDFSLERVKSSYNAELANGLGNLVNRIKSLANKINLQFEPTPIQRPALPVIGVLDHYRLEKGAQYCWGQVSSLNREVEQEKPWEDLAQGRIDSLQKKLRNWNAAIEKLTQDFSAYLPDASQKILTRRPGILFPRIK